MFVVSWGTESYGARNVARGEYDTCLYYRVILGLPVYYSFRGCVHVIEPAKLRSAERLDRIRSFLTDYLGWSEDEARNLPGAIHLTLRPSRALKGMAWLDSLLWLTGIVAALGVLVTAAISQQPHEPFRRENLLFLVPFWAAAAAFLALLVPYLVLRRPSPRQARVRAVVADALGPSSDIAEWTTGLVAPVAAAFGVDELDPDELVEEAERRTSAGKVEQGLLLARMALALRGADAEAGLVGRAEAVTDDCLRRLDE
jgi:hypothetical protein